MAQATAEVFINRPPGEVFVYTADLTNAPDWASGVEEVTPTGVQAIGPTASWQVLQRILGRPLIGNYVTGVYEHGHRFAANGLLGPFMIHDTFIFEPSGNGTIVRLDAEAQPKGLLRLMGPLLQWSVSRRAERALERLRQQLESGAGAEREEMAA